MSYTKVMYQRPTTTRDAISIRTTRPAPRKPKSSRPEIISKLKATYSHAARAFLHHRIEEANELVEVAFELLHPPASQEPDQLTTYRRKWDILRITLETTLYTTPLNGSATFKSNYPLANGSSSGTIPRSPNGSPRSKTPLDDPLLLSPPSLLGTLHTRSLKLFTPALERPNSRFLPAAVLVALVLASLKLDCPQVGRGMVEDWLANRDSLGLGSEVDGRKGTKADEREGYEKAVEVYCLHVLPRLNEWDYAKDFLDSEMEMRPSKREALIATLAAHHAQSLLPPSPRANQLQNLDNSVSGSSGAPTPRAASPAPSSVSSHTAVPNSRSVATLGASQVLPLPLSPSPTPTARQRKPINMTSGHVPSSLGIPPLAPILAPQSSSPAQPTTLQLLKAVIIPYLRRVNAPVLLLAIVLSFIGLASRFGRRPKGGNGAEMTRRRLTGGSGGLWAGLVDAVKMSGRGLV
ncbi:hypothetical protein RSOL_493000 [Rhizoctonia solani AG-3 Rhs1AP]|uniref:Uncharacterized protein n=1 Tax=Rhizoctonia solani AG-3 Rhs1AP TaxID=1086054 RepID=X8JLM5_9AGAM|nr:hypothetical protein RSOL_493000 [Rhizoctonia solani AG-3 Rhs1AP]